MKTNCFKRRSLLFSGVIALAAFALAGPAARAAQPAAAVVVTGPQMEADVRELMAIDQRIADLGKEAAATKMARPDYAVRLAPLTQARNDVVKRYGGARSAEYRELIARINEVKKEQAQAVVEAKRAADKEKAAQLAAEKANAVAAAQAKVAADRETAKRAAEAVAAAQLKVIEEDAQAYTRLAMRHDELLVKANARRASDAERSEMPGLRLKGDEIKKKYAPGGASHSRAAEYEKRVKELSDEVIAPARKGWLAETFPASDAVVGAFSDGAHQLAALRIIDRLLYEMVGQPLIPAAAAKVSAYRAAMEKINPASGSNRVKLQDASDKLIRSNQFQFDVLSKFVPASAGPAEQALKKEKYEARVRAENQRINLGIMGVIFLVGLLPVLFLLRGEHPRPKAVPADDAANPFHLPQAAAHVAVFRKDYFLAFDCGLVFDKEVWTETHTTTTYHPGQSVVIGNTVQSTAGHTSTHTSTTLYHRYWIRTPDGKETWKRFSDDAFPASKGQLVSTVNFDTHVLLAYNHATGGFAPLTPGIRAVNQMKGRWLWLTSVGVALAGFFAVDQFLVPGTIQAQDPHSSGAVGALMIGTAVCSGIYIGIIKVIVQFIRHRQFRSTWMPALRNFMEERTPYLEKHYSLEERTRAASESSKVSRAGTD